jgi:hypothetical protein
VLSRNIKLDVTCLDAPFFKFSESPNYQETIETGVVVTIDQIDPQGKYAEVSIRYPNGTTGGNAIPFAVTETTREVRILVVLFNFSDGSLATPSYATTAWAHKLVFGGNHDGRGLANSIKAHIEQNTYGTVKVSGEVYPNWVEVSPLETYRDLNLTPTPARKFAEEIVQRLVDTDPDFFTGKDFDFLIALTPGGLMATTLRGDQIYSNWPDEHDIFEGWTMFDIPIDGNSQLYDTIHDERRVSISDTIVVPRYNPSTVEGVWLANDVAHAGINYFTGGQVRYDTSNPNRYAHFIELGTALPSANTEVIITYYPRAWIRLTEDQMASVPPDTMPETVNYGHMMHELYHGIGWLLNTDGQVIGDLYHSPQQLIEPYGLMSGGAWNNYKVGDVRYYVPGNLSAYSRVKLGMVQPYTLRYGENEIGVRLHKAEEGDLSGTNDRIKVIKVPLHPANRVVYRQLVEYPDSAVTFGGDEYLLLEWRYVGELENGAYNFDEALPYQGLVIYRIIEGDPNSRHGDKNKNLIRIADATPPFSAFPFDSLKAFWMEDVFSLETSAAPLGPASDVYSYVAAAPWNWKAGTSTTADFQLSPDNGEKTIYAKFMDLNGQLVGQTTLSVSLSESVNTPPVADAGSDQTLSEEAGQGALVSLNGSQSHDPDGTIVSYAWQAAESVIASDATATVNLPVGQHTITLVVADDQGASSSDDVLVTVLAANVPPEADAGDDVTVIDADQDGGESVLLDGSGSSDADGNIVAYDWYKAGTCIARGASASAKFGVGKHSVTLSVTDDSGQVSSDSLVVEVSEGSVPAPVNLTATVVGGVVTLTWSDTADNEAGFYVERGEKVKKTVQYTRVAATGPSVNYYAEALPAGTYYFRVRAFGSSGVVSDYSNPVQVRIKRGGKG